MKARVVVTDEDLKIAAAEGMHCAHSMSIKLIGLIEKIRRHDVMARM